MKDVSRTSTRAPEKVTLKHKRRYCKVEGCIRIVKSQGVCQRHGAKPRKCKIATCTKQAQGNYNGMCKAHFRASKNTTKEQEKTTTPPFCQPVLVLSKDTRVTNTREPCLQGHELSEDSTVTSSSAVTEEDTQARDLWDEPFFCSNSTRSEELAADLFGDLTEPNSSCEEWAVGPSKQLLKHHRILSVSGIPSCSDYVPIKTFSEMRDSYHSAFMDYYVHENAGVREEV